MLPFLSLLLIAHVKGFHRISPIVQFRYKSSSESSHPASFGGISSRSHTLYDKRGQSESEVRDELRSVIENVSTERFGDRAFLSIDEGTIKELKTKRGYLSIVVERLVQAIDDYQLSESMKKGYSDANLNINRSGPEGQEKEKVIVLGSGWGGHAFLKTIDASKYDVSIVSPRNFFLFTPMLAASAVGTVELRSITEPIRNVNPLVSYIEASCNGADFERKVIRCQGVKCQGTSCGITDFELPYDHLVVAVGASVNTFGIKGVREHCQFLKQAEDASSLRRAIANCFERANVPSLSEEEVKAALSFVIVGAGPTGVEFTSELRDWIENEGRRYYGRLLKYVRISLVEAGGAVLMVFDQAMQEEALYKLSNRKTRLIEERFIEKEMTSVMLKVGVKEIDESFVHLSNGEKLAYGFCVWAAGNGPSPVVLDMIDSLAEQKSLQDKARGRLVADSWLRVRGTNGSVFAIGDCSFLDETPLPANAQVASQQGAYLGRLFSKGFSFDRSSVPIRITDGTDDEAEGSYQEAQIEERKPSDGIPEVPDNGGQTPIEIERNEKSTKIDFVSERYNIGSLATGEYKASENAESDKSGVTLRGKYAKPFQFLNLGVLAYIGASEAIAQIAVDEKLIFGMGPIGFLLWRGIYLSKQVSWRNRVLVAIDWIKARLFGRDLTTF